jgi:predicted RNA-binding Zn-ribbon protein involved in translation (DUF1610 family)
MICNTCGINNDEENKYCINCGEELTAMEITSLNTCPNCGEANDKTNKFCVSCGFQLIQKSEIIKNTLQPKKMEIHGFAKSKKQLRRESKNNLNRNPARKTSNINNLKFLWITVGIVIGSIIIASAFDLIFNNSTGKKVPTSWVEQKSANPIVEAKVYEIASKFVCSCGTCNEESLELCNCERAVEERQFIRDYLEQSTNSGQKPDDIVYVVANKYGWMKAEFASKYKVDSSKVWNSTQLQVTKDIISNTPGLINTKATISDKYTIYSAFNCPCGKCSIDELKDCTCNHPNGANEVKRFIDEKINENKYTIKEIIETVDNKFGGKKI